MRGGFRQAPRGFVAQKTLASVVGICCAEDFGERGWNSIEKLTAETAL